jgi:hypothetical protein
MDDQAGARRDRVLSVLLDLYVDRQPISGRLRTEWGADERFVGWLGFVDMLKILSDAAGAGPPGKKESQC